MNLKAVVAAGGLYLDHIISLRLRTIYWLQQRLTVFIFQYQYNKCCYNYIQQPPNYLILTSSYKV